MSMKKRKPRTIFNNYYSDESFESARECAFEDGDYATKDDVPDDVVWSIYNDNLDFNWETQSTELESFLNASEYGFVIRGTVGRWDGRYDAGSVVHTLGELSKAWNDCDYLHIYDENGHLFIDCSHHDGNNHWELRKLNKKGAQYLLDHEYDMDPRTLHKRLWDSHYSSLPHFVHTQFGCPKQEYA